MSFRHEWVIPRHVFYGKYWGEITSKDTAAIARDTAERLAAVESRLHYIADMLEVTTTPKNLAAVRQIIDLVKNPKVGHYIVIGKPNITVDLFITAIVTVTKVRFYRAESYQDAIKFLKEVDQTLDWLRYTEPQQTTESVPSQQTV